MGFVSHSPPNYEGAAAAYGVSPGPVQTAAFVSQTLPNKVNGIMNMVFGAPSSPRVVLTWAIADGIVRSVRRRDDLPRDAR